MFVTTADISTPVGGDDLYIDPRGDQQFADDQLMPDDSPEGCR
ncbi:hypothetical protein ACFWPK_29020 [Nocardia sp. NPDC058519]